MRLASHSGLDNALKFPSQIGISFVNDESTEIAVGVKQYAMVNAQRQLIASEFIADAPNANQTAVPLGVVLKLDDDADIDASRLPGGSAGTVAIYTENAKPAHVIRKVMLRIPA